MLTNIRIRPESLYGKREALPDGLPSNLPGAKVILALYELTSTPTFDGSHSETYSAIQTMDGSLQPLNAIESSKYSKEMVTANYRFLVGKSVFINATNEGKLKETNQIRYGTRKFDIIFVENRTEGALPHYKVILQEIF